MATREIIVLDAAQDTTGVNLVVTAAFWLVAPVSRVVPMPTFVSRVPVVASVSWGVSSSELSQLQAGTLVEQVTSVSFAVAGLTTAAIEAGMQARYAALQSVLTSLVFSTVHFVGAFWDGTTWTAGP
jgi:hypothetical protein